MKLFNRCEGFVREKEIIKRDDKILVAVSGGPDSIFLLHFLYHIKDKYSLSLKVAFIHHHIRKQTDKEFLFVKDKARKMNLPFYYRNIFIDKKKGVEEKAREKRYKALYEIARKTGCNKIATGHNLDDNVESVLMNFFRGTGLAGLGGIFPERRIYKNSEVLLIRPLLVLRKKEIEDFLKEKKIKFYFDRTNVNLKYKRNLMRHKIIPYIENYFPSFSETVSRTSFLLQDDFLFIEKTAIEKLNSILKGNKFNVEKFKKLDLSIKRFVIQMLIEKTKGEKYRSFNRIENLREFIEKIKEKEIPFSIIEKKIKGKKEKKEIYKEIEVPGECVVDEFFIKSEYVKFSPSIFENKDKYTGYFDGEKAGEKIVVRTRKDGDRFIPLGMRKEKKISRVLIDKKIPVFERDEILIFQSKNKIMWVCGVEISEKFKVSNKTKKILKITVKKQGKSSL